ncbi:MAG: acyltransferase family protein [Chloroflexota bacterium]
MTAATDLLRGRTRPRAPEALPAPQPGPIPAPDQPATTDAAPGTQVAERVAVREKAGELTYVRSVRAIAMIGIVTLHISFPLIYLYNSISYSDWWAANFFYMFGKAGTPLFVMVSGLLLLDPGKPMVLSTFFRRRFLKVLWPFLVWGAIYMVYRAIMKDEVFGPRDVLDAFLNGPVYYHLWFIQMILGLYLITPILRIFIAHATRKDLTYFLTVWFVGLIVLPTITRFTGLQFGIELMVATGWVGFFVLGYALKDVVLDRRGIRIAVAVIIGGILFTQLATHALTVAEGGTFDNFWQRNESLNIIAISVGTFLVLKSLDWDAMFSKVKGLRFVLMNVSNNSFGIYFVHVIVIETLALGFIKGIHLDGQSFLPLIAIPVTSAVVITISATLVTIMKRIPGVRTIVP